VENNIYPINDQIEDPTLIESPTTYIEVILKEIEIDLNLPGLEELTLRSRHAFEAVRENFELLKIRFNDLIKIRDIVTNAKQMGTKSEGQQQFDNSDIIAYSEDSGNFGDDLPITFDERVLLDNRIESFKTDIIAYSKDSDKRDSFDNYRELDKFDEYLLLPFSQPESLGDFIETMYRLLPMSEDKPTATVTDIDVLFNDYQQILSQQELAVNLNRLYLSKIEGLRNDQDLISHSQELQQRLQGRIEGMKDRLAAQQIKLVILQNYPQNVLGKYEIKAWDELSLQLDNFSNFHKLENGNVTEQVNKNDTELAGIPAEAVTLCRQYLDLVRLISSPNTLPVNYRIIKKITDIVSKLRRAHKNNIEFPESKDILWHGSPKNNCYKILSSGLLGSRNSQVVNLGSASFTTGVVKHPFQEYDQICFSQNSPHNWNFDFGWAFLFSKPYLLSNSQFMCSDGLHLFNRDFRTDTPGSPGYQIDLVKQPFVIAIRTKRDDIIIEDRDNVCQILKSVMLNSEAWQNVIRDEEDFENWIKNHVIFYEDNNFRGVSARAFEMLTDQGLPKIKAGCFRPSGEWGENAIQGRVPLNAYSPDPTPHNIIEKPESINYELLNPLLISDELLPIEVIKLLRVNPLLDACFSANSGRKDRYTIEERTIKVLEQFEKYFGVNFHQDARVFFRTLLLLHDIGKPISVREYGDFTSQNEHAKRILEYIMPELGYNEEQIQLAVSLISQEYLHDYMRIDSNVDINKIIDKITQEAKILRINPQFYFEMIKVVYMSYYSSYTKFAENRPSLDYLFEENNDHQSIGFSTKPTFIHPFNNMSPNDYFNKLEEAVRNIPYTF